MPANINDLPYELLSQILEIVLRSNVEQNSRKTYAFDMGLHAPPDPDVRMQRLLKGLMTPDSVRWTASDTIRRVNPRWHDLALKYSFKDLYVLSWRGSEKYTLSGIARTKPLEHLGLSTSSEFSPFLGKTAKLLENHPTLSSYIRRIWFDGYYEAKESAVIFGMLRQCKKLEDLLVSWTALRHGTVADWSSLFGSNAAGPCITSLEIRAMNLSKRSPAMKKENQFDNNALESTSVDFSNLVCLRLFGNSKFMTITDKDLIAIARTATNIRELHMSNAASLGPKGIGTLIRSSRLSLEVLELDRCFQMEPEQSEQYNDYSHIRLPQFIAQCPFLRRLRLQSVHTCRDIFSRDDVVWSGKVQIYLGVNSSFEVPQTDEDTTILYQVLDQARRFMNSRTRTRTGETSVEIEIFTGRFMFEPRCATVYGDFPMTHALREPWLYKKKESHRNVQMIGYERAFPFCITEDEFKVGLDKGYVWL